MNIAVFSDSHNETKTMCRVIDTRAPDMLIHLGDLVADARYLHGLYPHLPLHFVSGNCDYAPQVPDHLLLEVQGVRIFLAHGHRYTVKLGLDQFYNSVCCSGADIGLFGHTHIPLLRQLEGAQLLNPGACGASHPSYGWIEIENGAARCSVCDA